MMSLARMPEREAVLECFLILSREIRDQEGRSCASSCPSPMRSSPMACFVKCCGFSWYSNMEDTLSVEELQSAVQGAVAHCKNSMMQNKTVRDQ
ncbi:hypothetical protein NC652_021616 [Populus alba x Populus x berolinensis]|nr:hypothetical protein NC652_021616 [Populus alba x Populus x berolinensis]